VDDLWATKSEDVGLIVSKIFNLCGHDPPTSQTDRRTTCDSKTALCTVVHRAVKTTERSAIPDIRQQRAQRRLYGSSAAGAVKRHVKFSPVKYALPERTCGILLIFLGSGNCRHIDLTSLQNTNRKSYTASFVIITGVTSSSSSLSSHRPTDEMHLGYNYT